MSSRPSAFAGVGVVANSSFPGFALLYIALYGAYGSESPFFPSFLASRSLSPGEIGTVLSLGTAVRLCFGPFLGMLADRYGTRRLLAIAAASAGGIGLLYLPSGSFSPLLVVSVLHSVSTASLAPLSDALALNSSARETAYPYGWVRGVGSASFLLGTLASGQLVVRFGLASIIVASSVCFLMMVVPIPRLPPTSRAGRRPLFASILAILAIPAFRRILVVAAMVIGSHAMSDAFAVIHWRASGIGDGAIGALLAEAVGSEIVVFFLAGPFLLRRMGPAGCVMLAATAGALRWGVFAQTTVVSLLAATELLHGLTFSLVHLACMQVISASVPEEMSATAQTLYGTLCLGAASAVLTLASGIMFGAFGAEAFWSMAALSAAAAPIALALPGRGFPPKKSTA